MSKIYLTELVESLEQLADREFQKRSWLAEHGPVISSFSEQVSQAFDDTGLSHAIDNGSLEMEVGADAARALGELDKAISKVDDELPPKELLDHVSMQRVRYLAQCALQKLHA